MKKRIPTFGSDEETERFVAEADLSQYDLSGAKPVPFEFERGREGSDGRSAE